MIEFKNCEEGQFEVHYEQIGMIGWLVFDDDEGKWFYEDFGAAIIDSKDLRTIADKLDELGYEP